MGNNDYYKLLELSPNASPEVIKAAYFSLLKKNHPDSYNGDPAEAEQIIQKINLAYSVLSDPVKRKEYDGTGVVTKSTPKVTSNTASTQKAHGNSEQLKEKTFLYSKLEPQIKSKIAEEIILNNSNKNYIISHGGLWRYYFWSLVLVLWYVILFYNADGYRWSDDSWVWVLVVSAIVNYVIARNVYNIVRWHTLSFKDHTVLTPLYLVQIEFDKFRIWPFWNIKDVRATHNYRNGVFISTEIVVQFSNSKEVLQISPRAKAEEFLEKLKSYRVNVLQHIQQKDFVYLLENDIFGEIKGVGKVKGGTLLYKVLSIVFVASALLLAGVYVLNSEKPVRVETPLEKMRHDDAFNQPTQPLSLNGAEKNYSSNEDLAPLEIITNEGLYHHFVKLVDWNTKKVVKTIFIRAGKSIDIEVPLGSYEIKYASGEKWYGKQYLFGPDTIYSKADKKFDFIETYDGYSGYTIELILQLDGNLSTSHISPAQW